MASRQIAIFKRTSRRALALSAALCLLFATTACSAQARKPASRAASPRYAPQEIVVGYAASGAATAAAATATARAASPSRRGAATPESPRTRVIRLPPGESMHAAIARLRRRHGVLWAVPNFIARTGAVPVPDDTGGGVTPGGWETLQWNFAGPFGVGALEAWANLAADGAPGGQGVIVAVLDTGVAYANHGRFRRSPDFSRYTFVNGYDFIGHNRFPEDRNGHGTFVAGTIAEETNNRFALTGLAFGARIMPVRVLDDQGEGEASTIAEGVRYAVRHGAQIINLSLEFSPGVTASDIPELISALRYARRRNVLVVAAAGNEAHTAIAYPARAPDVVAVGATTEHGCLAAYSNDGSGLTLVAPGGGADANLPGDPNCKPEAPAGADIYQMTLTGSSPRRFGLPSGYEGTSMAAPHVTATAALVIASRVLGRHPTPAQIVARLRTTARRLGGGGDEALYGAGLVNAAAATAPVAPRAVAK